MVILDSVVLVMVVGEINSRYLLLFIYSIKVFSLIIEVNFNKIFKKEILGDFIIILVIV